MYPPSRAKRRGAGVNQFPSSPRHPPRGPVVEAFDPPLYDKSKERVRDSHYFVKDFRPLSLGKLKLDQGRGMLRLKAESMTGDRVIDVHSIRLIRQ